MIQKGVRAFFRSVATKPKTNLQKLSMDAG